MLVTVEVPYMHSPYADLVKVFPLLPRFIVQEMEIQKSEVIGLKSHS